MRSTLANVAVSCWLWLSAQFMLHRWERHPYQTKQAGRERQSYSLGLSQEATKTQFNIAGRSNTNQSCTSIKHRRHAAGKPGKSTATGPQSQLSRNNSRSVKQSRQAMTSETQSQGTVTTREARKYTGLCICPRCSIHRGKSATDVQRAQLRRPATISDIVIHSRSSTQTQTYAAGTSHTSLGTYRRREPNHAVNHRLRANKQHSHSQAKRVTHIHNKKHIHSLAITARPKGWRSVRRMDIGCSKHRDIAATAVQMAQLRALHSLGVPHNSQGNKRHTPKGASQWGCPFLPPWCPGNLVV